MSTATDKVKKLCFGLRIVSYICGFTGMIMMLMARGMTEPDSTVWGQRAFLFLTVMFCGFIACYVLAFVTNFLRKK